MAILGTAAGRTGVFGRTGLAILCIGLGAAGPPPPEVADGLALFKQGRFAEAQREWREAADAGDANAALYVGVSEDVGLGVQRDSGQAALWYAKAAALGSATAMFNLAVLYDAGRGVRPDPAQAALWYRRAADHGYARAEYNLGLMNQDGGGIPRNRERALYWFRRAAHHGLAAAQMHMAQLGDRSRAAGPRLAEDSSLQAFQEAETVLLSRKPEEVSRAAQLFHAAAEANNALAAYDLAYCYENAIGVPRDMKRAFQWYSRAAEGARDEGLKSLASNSAAALAGRLTPLQLSEVHADPGFSRPGTEPGR